MNHMKLITALFVILANVSLAFSAELTPAEIIKKVQENYKGFKTYSAEGTTISDMRPPGAKVSNPITNFFSVKLAKPDLYNIEWAQPMTPTRVNEGATWGDGMGNFLMLMNQGTCRAMKDRDTALRLAGGSSGSASITTPSLFFDTKGSAIKEVKDYVSEKDETLDNESCYVLAGRAEGQKVRVWITKKGFLVKQKQFLIGEPPEPTDDDVKEALKQAGRDATPEAIQQMKAQIMERRKKTIQLQGTITENYQKIAADKPLRKEDYIRSVPKGIQLLEH